MSSRKDILMTRESMVPARRPTVAEEAASAGAAVRSVDVGALDRSNDATHPNTKVTRIIRRTREVSRAVRRYATKLGRMKVTVADADQLDALADALDERERAWQQVRHQVTTGSVADARGAVMTLVDTLAEALGVFVDEGHPTHAALAEVSGAANDDDRETYALRVTELARRHAHDLDGTDYGPEYVARCVAAIKRFRDARIGDRTHATDGTTIDREALSAEAREAVRLRNRVFWALAARFKLVAKRAKFGLADDPAASRVFLSYNHGSRVADAVKREAASEDVQTSDTQRDAEKKEATKGGGDAAATDTPKIDAASATPAGAKATTPSEVTKKSASTKRSDTKSAKQKPTVKKPASKKT
jgi:hypothetical protein